MLRPRNVLGSLTLISLYVSSTLAQSNDPCVVIAGNKTASFQQAKACLDYFKFDQDIAQQTVDTVRKVTNELYVFNVNSVVKVYFIKKDN